MSFFCLCKHRLGSARLGCPFYSILLRYHRQSLQQRQDAGGRKPLGNWGVSGNFLEAGRSVAQVRQAAQTLLHDAKYGHVLRVKGFIPDGGGWVELNAARDAITVQPIPSGQEVLIVIGEGLDKAAIETAVMGC